MSTKIKNICISYGIYSSAWRPDGSPALIFKGSGSGLLVNLIVGLVGGILGGWLVSLFGWVPTGTLGTFLSSVIGAIVLLWIVSLFTRHKTVKTM